MSKHSILKASLCTRTGQVIDKKVNCSEDETRKKENNRKERSMREKQKTWKLRKMKK